MSMEKLPLTDERREYLLANHETKTSTELSKGLHVSVPVVREWLTSLGIKAYETPRLPQSFYDGTAHELIRELWLKETNAEIGRRLGVSANTVRRHASDMGLCKKPLLRFAKNKPKAEVDYSLMSERLYDTKAFGRWRSCEACVHRPCFKGFEGIVTDMGREGCRSWRAEVCKGCKKWPCWPLEGKPFKGKAERDEFMENGCALIRKRRLNGGTS